MSLITLPAPAKLNLCLHINTQREDGYHEIQTLFQFIDLCDYLSFNITDSPEIAISSDITDLPESSNLIYKAAKLLQQHQSIPLKETPKGAQITLKKNIPIGGGLGGGSSDAATTLIALNILWKIDLSITQLAKLGLTLGADIPVFIHGHAAWAEGIGEKLTNAFPSTPWYLVLQPDCKISTREIFLDKRLTRDTSKLKIAPALKGDLPDLFPLGNNFNSGIIFKNDCEWVVCNKYPKVRQAIQWLSNHSVARLTGTGSCIFAPFSSRRQAETTSLIVPATLKAYVVKALNVSPLILSLRELEKSSL